MVLAVGPRLHVLFNSLLCIGIMTPCMRYSSSSCHKRSSMKNTNCSASQKEGDPSRQDSDPPDDHDQELWDDAYQIADQLTTGFDSIDCQDATLFDDSDDGTNELLDEAVQNRQQIPDSLLHGDLIDFIEDGVGPASLEFWQQAASLPEVNDHQHALASHPVSESSSGFPGFDKTADSSEPISDDDITNSTCCPYDVYDMARANGAARGDCATSDDDDSVSSMSIVDGASTSTRSADNVVAKAYEQAMSVCEKMEQSQRMDSAPSRSATPIRPTKQRSRCAKPRAGWRQFKDGPVPKLKKWSSLDPDEQLKSLSELANIISSQMEVRKRYDAIRIIAPNCTLTHTDGVDDFVIDEDMRKGINDYRFMKLQKFVRQHASGCGVEKPTSQDSPEPSEEDINWLPARPEKAAFSTGRTLHPALEAHDPAFTRNYVIISHNANEDDDDVNILD